MSSFSSACLCLLVAACSAQIEGVDTDGGTSKTGGAGASTGTAGTGHAGGPSATTGAGGSTGEGGQGGDFDAQPNPPDAGLDRSDAGIEAADDRGAGGDAVPDVGPPPAIDYSIWELQLPTGSGTSPTTVSPSELATFSNIYFYKAQDGGQMFMSPATGTTTPNSTRCRTELRESDSSGRAAAWSSAGTNVMTVTGKVLMGSSITIGQVFNGPDGITLAELQYSTGGFSLFYEEARGQGQNFNLGNRTALDTRYTYTMEFSKNVLTVSINGNQVFMRTPSSGILASTFYFKAGNYDQTTSSGTAGTTPHSIVEAYSISVVHQ
jgi:hypothetical protein